MNRQARTLSALGAVVVTAAAVLVTGPGYDSEQVRMLAGTAWLSSNRTGEVVLANGSTAELSSKVAVEGPDTPLAVTQQGSAALVLDQDSGALSRVDSATLEVTRSAASLSPGRAVVVKSAPDVVYGVDVHSGTVTSVDPRDLRPLGEPKKLAVSIDPDDVVVDDRGRLWVVDSRTGDLVWLDDGVPRSRSNPTTAGRLVLTAGQAALVDPERGTAELVHPESGAVVRSVRMDLGAGDAIALSGSPDRQRVLVTDGTTGDLVVCTFDTSSCAAPVRVGSAGSELGPAVEVSDHAVVPDYSTGQAVIVDLASSKVIAHRQLFEQPTRFELISRDGIVFFNDPNGAVAGVLDLTGVKRTITKYTEKPQEGISPAKPDTRAQANSVATRRDPATKPDSRPSGQPIAPGRTQSPIPPPSPTGSIVVKPGNRGVVGDRFELSMVLQTIDAAGTRWDFGDGTQAIGGTVTHLWLKPGSFTVEALTGTSTGAQVRAEAVITIDSPQTPPRIAQLNVQRPKPVVGEKVRFSAEASGKPDKWAWTVTLAGKQTPETTATTPEFSHAFTTPGTYSVALTITSGTKTAQSAREFRVVRGVVRGWGFDMFGQLDIPADAESGVVAIDAGNYHGLALKADGSVISWNTDPTPPEALSGVVAISAGGSHSLALKETGQVIAWGFSADGRTAVPPLAQTDVTAISAGEEHNLALRKDGSVVAWGRNYELQTNVPEAALHDVIAIGAGNTYSVALKRDRSLVFWGMSGNGENVPPPEAMNGISVVKAAFNYVVALKEDGSVISWGDNSYGQRIMPDSVRSGVVAVDTGAMHSVALKGDGSVIAFGRDRFGATDVPDEYSTGAIDVAAGLSFSLVLLEGDG